MGREKKPITDETLAEWLRDFKAQKTQSTYLFALRKFKEEYCYSNAKDY